MDEQYIKMTETPVGRLIGKLAVPTVISMLITSIYNLVDAFFVGKLGTSASGAIGIVLVLQSVIQAFGFTFGHGAGSIISRKLGEKDTDSAARFASTSFFLSLLTGVLLAAAGLLFLDPLLRLLGSTDTILPYARQYGFYILLAAPFMAGSCVMNNIMRYEGHATLAMIGLTAGGLLNMAGDPLFIFVFRMGVAGAGLSTALSQLISFLILLYLFLSGRTQSRLSFRCITRSWGDVKNILVTGFPSLIRQGLNSVSTMALNNSAKLFGDAAIAAMSIVGRICMLIGSLMIGVGQGLQPVAAFNYGAKKYARVKKAFRFTFAVGEIALTLLAAAGLLVSAGIVRIFRDDPEVIRIGVTALRLQCISLVLMPLGVCANMTFQSIGESKRASFVSLLRSGLYFLPIVFFLPKLAGLWGVQLAQPIADVLTFVTVLPMVISFLKRLPDSDGEAPSAGQSDFPPK